MKRRFQELRTWYFHTDRELFRREVDWVLRWFRSPTGLGLLALFLLLNISSSYFYIAASRGKIAWSYLNLGNSLDVAAGLVNLCIWVTLIQKRAFPPFRKTRIQDLQLSRLTPNDLWPAFLVAPVLADVVMTFIQEFCQLVASTYSDDSLYAGMNVTSQSMSWMDDFLAEAVRRLQWLGLPIALVMNVILAAGLAAYVVRWALPKGGIFRTVLHMFIAGLILGLPSLRIYMLRSLWQIFVNLGIQPSAYKLQILGNLFQWITPYTVGVFLIPALQVVIGYWMFKLSLRSLRSNRMRDRLLAYSESP